MVNINTTDLINKTSLEIREIKKFETDLHTFSILNAIEHDKKYIERNNGYNGADTEVINAVIDSFNEIINLINNTRNNPNTSKFELTKKLHEMSDDLQHKYSTCNTYFEKKAYTSIKSIVAMELIDLEKNNLIETIEYRCKIYG